MNNSPRLLKPLICLTLLAALTGCGALTDVRSFSTPYATPTSAETVRLRVMSDGMVRAVPNSNCINFRLPGAGVMVVNRDGYADRNGESLGMAPVERGSDATVMSELRVPAGQPIAFHYIGNRCYNMFTFVPEAGMDYELDAAGRYKCGVTLKRMLVGKTEGTRVPLGESKLCNWGDNF
ncbi:MULTISPECIES: hypothetical protein [Pseudomonas fluorescens group]|nr:hypothetical protein [Pseudomonas marginalis]MCM2378137.1 hypothetical protein [Pseudomonas marginalis]RMO55810.1 hypothetical protein ALQ38_00441 [Pseudomonas marginalis pv. marginalis]